MAETFFSINDLLRRKLQTGLVVAGMTLCVASTLFLFLLGNRIGFGIVSVSQHRLTASFSTMFWQFIVFVGALILAVGVVIISFLVFVMMSQRSKDIGLMKAAGCPNGMIFGYFVNELTIITIGSCFLGVIFGTVADYASVSLLRGSGFQVSEVSASFWLAVVTFFLFFVLSLAIGTKPVLNSTKVKPAIALSPNFSFGLSRESDFRGVSKAGFTVKMAVRSLFRHKSASFRAIICLTAVFVLATVSIAGGIIAEGTTKSWVESAIGRDVILIAHRDMSNQYKLLLSSFYDLRNGIGFNYTDEKYSISEAMFSQLESVSAEYGLSIDSRLIMEAEVEEVQGITLGQSTADTKYVGDHRLGASLIVGLEPEAALCQWYVDGRFLNGFSRDEIVIGDSVANTMFSTPLVQSMKLSNRTLKVVGVCLDPINSGNVTYILLKTLQNITGASRPNIAMVRIDNLTFRKEALRQINAIVKEADEEFETYQLNEILDKTLDFLSYIWSTIMLLPLLSLSAAILCLIGYVVLIINEQRQEFGILRAVGARPKAILKIILTQNLLVLLSSYGAGVALGIVATLLILIPEPLVTNYTIIQIAAWLSLAPVTILVFSLYPALRFSRKPILETIT